MISRYNFMLPSAVKDTDDVQFPDPLSLNYKKIIESDAFKAPALQVEIDEDFKLKPYLQVYIYYQHMGDKGQADCDDIILDMNNIKHTSLLTEGDLLLFPDPNEFSAFISKTTGY